MTAIYNEHDEPEKVKERLDQEDPYVMYLIVNKDLNMSAGKIGAQVGHAVGMIFIDYYENYVMNMNTMCNYSQAMQNWKNESYRKVVLQAHQKDFDKIMKEHHCYAVRDSGLTEVDPGSVTVLGFWPMKKSEVPKAIKKLQLLK